jgi:hypothetical protein
MQLSSLGYRTVEPNPIAPEEPSLLRRILEVQQVENGYSIDELIQMADVPASVLTTHELTGRPTLHAVK